jgi:hypothetical protein
MVAARDGAKNKNRTPGRIPAGRRTFKLGRTRQRGNRLTRMLLKGPDASESLHFFAGLRKPLLVYRCCGSLESVWSIEGGVADAFSYSRSSFDIIASRRSNSLLSGRTSWRASEYDVNSGSATVESR